MSIVIFVEYTPKEGQKDALLEALTSRAADVHAEAGCEKYAFHTSKEKVYLIESWSSKEDLAAHAVEEVRAVAAAARVARGIAARHRLLDAAGDGGGEHLAVIAADAQRDQRGVGVQDVDLRGDARVLLGGEVLRGRARARGVGEGRRADPLRDHVAESLVRAHARERTAGRERRDAGAGGVAVAERDVGTGRDRGGGAGGDGGQREGGSGEGDAGSGNRAGATVGATGGGEGG